MTTAPPKPHLHFASPHFSPASHTPSDSGFSWPPMPPPKESNAPNRPKSKPPPAAKPHAQPANNGDYTFVTATEPAHFRDRDVMTVVRKKAMRSHLEDNKKTGKKRKGPSERSRQQSGVSNASIVSIDGTDPSTINSSIPTIASERATSVGNFTTSSSSVAALSGHDQYAQSRPGESPNAPAQGLLQPAPIVEPSREGPLPYDQHTTPLFVSIGTPWDPFATMFQSTRGIFVEGLKYQCSMYFGTKSLGKYWIPTALDHPHTFLGTLCLATAYNDVAYDEPLDSMHTIELRQEVIHLVNRNMGDPEKRVADHNLMAVIQLIISEVIGRERDRLKYHEVGMEAMIRERGGLKELGLQGRLASSITWVSIASSILREEIPQTIYAEYGLLHSTKRYPITATLPESPLYCPQFRPSFHTLKHSQNCSTKALKLLGEMRTMIERLLDDTKQSRRNSESLLNIYKRIDNSASFSPISEMSMRTEKDWRYEAIRLTSIILAKAIARNVPLSRVLHSDSEPTHPLSLYTSVTASMSNESLISPFDPRRDSASEYFSNSYSLSNISPLCQTSLDEVPPPTTHRSSDLSMSAHSLSHPSVSTPFTRPSSIASGSSGHSYFPLCQNWPYGFPHATTLRSSDSSMSAYRVPHSSSSRHPSVSTSFTRPSTSIASGSSGYNNVPLFQSSQYEFPPPATHRSSNSSISVYRPSHPSVSTSFTRRPISIASGSSGHNSFSEQPAPSTSSTESLLEDLKNAIVTSNMSQCWSEMAGVLLWIGLVAGAATKDSKNKTLRKYFSAITMRAGILLCFEHPEAINATVLCMSQVVQALRPNQQGTTPTTSNSNSKYSGKRRRT